MASPTDVDSTRGDTSSHRVPAGEASSQFQSIAENAPDSVIRYDLEGRITFLNRKLIGYLGLADSSSIVGRRPSEVWPDGRFARIEEAVQQALLHGTETTVEYAEDLDGETVHHSVHVLPERDASGQTTGALAFGGRVTALRRAEAAAGLSDAMFRSLAESSPDIIVHFGADARATYSNPTLSRQVQLATPSFVGRTPAEALGSSGGLLDATLRRVLATGEKETIEVQLPSMGAALASYELVIVAERDARGAITGSLCLGRDLTERKRLESELRNVLRRAHAMVLYLELVAEPGWDPDAPETANCLRWQYRFEDERSAQAILPLSPRLGESYGDCWARSVQVDDARLMRRATVHAIARGLPSIQNEFRAIDRDGRVRWFDQVADIDLLGPMHWRVTSVITDITARRTLEDQLRQTQKLEAIGQLAGGVAHDFNNILGAIMMQLEELQLDPGLSDASDDVLQELRTATDRGAALVRQLLTFSRKSVMRTQEYDLNDLIRNFTKMLQRCVREDVELALKLCPHPLAIHGDAGMLEQVLMNLVTNASDAMSAGGRIVISTGDESDLPEAPGQVGASVATIRVTDSGAGIAPDDLPKIFDPFFTTKAPGKGTGLGLATVFGIVKQHKGTISVSSVPNGGTTFTVRLPQARLASRPSSTPSQEPDIPRGTESILMVEDDVAVRTSTRRLLVRSGYRVVEAANGAEAMRLWAERSTGFDLLLTDLIMPGELNGRQLAAQLRSYRPGLKVIFTSGYSADTAGRDLERLDGEDFLPKPCAPTKLLSTIRRVLDRADPPAPRVPG